MTTIGVDLDGILISFPGYFQLFFKAMQGQGVKVGIITARPASQKDDLRKELEKVGIKPDFFVAMPDNLKESNFPQGIFKGIVCTELKIDVLYDDFQASDPTMLGDFFTYNQGTIPFTSFAYKPE